MITWNWFDTDYKNELAILTRLISLTGPFWKAKDKLFVSRHLNHWKKLKNQILFHRHFNNLVKPLRWRESAVSSPQSSFRIEKNTASKAVLESLSYG